MPRKSVGFVKKNDKQDKRFFLEWHPCPCSTDDKALFNDPTYPSAGLIEACGETTNFAGSCFGGSDPGYVLNNLAISQTCSNCIYDPMTTNLNGYILAVSECLSATEDSDDCLSAVDDLIVNNCAADWSTIEGSNEAPSEDDTNETTSEDDTNETTSEDETNEEPETDETNEEPEDNGTNEETEDEETTRSPSSNDAMSLASSMVVAGAIIVASWSA